ncbi:MAG: N-6 DNA methylase [Planctomycetes bacterium]|nr:N-6 DNA methylase [Planctomycetota bacterium]
MTKKNKTKATAVPTPDKIEVRREGGKIWSHVRKKWLVETPEECVRQEFLRVLIHEYGFALEQIDEEVEVTGRGAGQARADFVIWRSAQDKADGRNPLIVVECKSDNVTIRREDYGQGDNYARLSGARFFVTHNSRETKFWRVLHDRMPKDLEEIENIPHADASDKEIDELLERLKTFKEDEFADLLHQCHNVIRNRDHLDPADAFDEIAKILFVKFYVERELREKKARKNIFTAEFLQEQIGDNPLEDLFQKTKKHYRSDRIFENNETLNLKPATGLEIVRKLERYNLSATSEDIKGIAFERFLGKTFRGDIGQYFTPRPIVEFMVRMVAPTEGDVICDPASGSGGFLIRFFEIVREQILAGADREYQGFKKKIEASKTLSDAKKAQALRAKYEEIQNRLAQSREESRLWNLANRCIYGTDANDRMARTSKMNMIMHGDGHGGVHHHDGFLNVNGIFEGRFDIILTNPPFGASVEPSDVVLEEQVTPPADLERRYIDEFGHAYREAQARARAAKGKPIASLFELPKGEKSKVKTEILFIERCLALLKPGGRLGIVLPEGIFNNPSLAYVREFCEDRARILAVVSLPQETFYSCGASVKASLLFMQKFAHKEKADFDRKKAAAEKEIRAKYGPRVKAETVRLEALIDAAKKTKDAKRGKELEAQLRQYQRDSEDRIQAETRALLKARWPYPIFLYEAEHVGITATGEPDGTELYEDPKLGLPPGVTADATAVALFRAFRANPQAFIPKGAEA